MISFATLPEEENDIEAVEIPETIKEQYFTYLHSKYEEDNDKWTRSSGIIPTPLKQATIVIIGVGGIGFNLLKQLAGIGLKNLHIFDFDTIDMHNVGPQGYAWHQVGQRKVDAAKETIFHNYGTEIFTYDMKVTSFKEIQDLITSPTVLICAIDNMELRKTLHHEFIEDSSGLDTDNLPKLYIDARMSLGTWTIYTLPVYAIYHGNTDTEELDDALAYLKKEGMFTDAEAVQEPCTAREINFTGEAISAKITSSLLYLFKNTDLINFPPGDFFNLESKEHPHKWLHSFNSLDWESITPTRSDVVANKKLRAINEQLRPTLFALNKSTPFLPEDLNKRIDTYYSLRHKGDLDIISSPATLNNYMSLLYQTIEELVDEIKRRQPKPDSAEQQEQEATDELLRDLVAHYFPNVKVGNQIKFYYRGSTSITSWYTVTDFFLNDSKELIVKLLEAGGAGIKASDVKLKFVREAAQTT